MYRIHAGSPRASPYDAAAPLQAYDLITTIRTPQTAFGGQLPFTWAPWRSYVLYSKIYCGKAAFESGQQKKDLCT